MINECSYAPGNLRAAFRAVDQAISPDNETAAYLGLTLALSTDSFIPHTTQLRWRVKEHLYATGYSTHTIQDATHCAIQIQQLCTPPQPSTGIRRPIRYATDRIKQTLDMVAFSRRTSQLAPQRQLAIEMSSHIANLKLQDKRLIEQSIVLKIANLATAKIATATFGVAAVMRLISADADLEKLALPTALAAISLFAGRVGLDNYLIRNKRPCTAPETALSSSIFNISPLLASAILRSIPALPYLSTALTTAFTDQALVSLITSSYYIGNIVTSLAIDALANPHAILAPMYSSAPATPSDPSH